MRCLVTGGAGFIGSNLVDALLARGDEVTVVDDLSTGRRENLDGALAAGAELVELDIRDAAAVAALALEKPARDDLPPGRADRRPQVGRRPRLRRRDQRRRHRQPARGRARRRAPGASSSSPPAARSTARARASSCRCPRATAIAPMSPTARASSRPRATWRSTSGSTASRGWRLRLGNVYGPRQDPLGEAGVIAIFCGKLREGGRPTVFGDGSQTRDYIYVGDVVAAALAAADSEATGPINIGTGLETDVLELAARLGELAAARASSPSFAPGPRRRGAADLDRPGAGRRARLEGRDRARRRTADDARVAHASIRPSGG